MSPFIECPSKNEFAAKLRTESHENIVDQYLFRGTPFAFRTSHASYDFLVELLANNLGLFADSITMVGSGRIGFTLDPDRFGAPFSVRSDLDVVVVSERMFDEAWFDMLRLGRKYLALEERVRRIVKSHRESYIYWGFVIPDRLPGVVRLSTHWFSTFRVLSRYSQFARFEIKGRLYRTWEYARVHQLNSLSRIMERLPQ